MRSPPLGHAPLLPGHAPCPLWPPPVGIRTRAGVGGSRELPERAEPEPNRSGKSRKEPEGDWNSRYRGWGWSSEPNPVRKVPKFLVRSGNRTRTDPDGTEPLRKGPNRRTWALRGPGLKRKNPNPSGKSGTRPETPEAMAPRAGLCSPPTPWRCAQALCCASAFSMAAASGPWDEGEGDGCVAAWALCFAFTLLLLLAHLAGRPPPRRDLPLALALASAIACGAAAILWPLGQLRDQPDGRRRHLRAAVTAASALAAVCYGAEVAATRGRPGEAVPYLATPPGLLKVAQCATAAVLLGVSAALGAAGGPAGWRWCLGIYGASVAAALLVVLVCGGILGLPGGCGGWDAAWARRLLVAYAALGAAAYGAATVLWPLEAFDEGRGGQSRRPYGCGARCPWDRAVLVALGTAGNLLLYLGDLAQAGRVVLLRV